MKEYEEYFSLDGPRGGSHCHTTSVRPVPSRPQKEFLMSNISRRQFFGSTAAVAAVGLTGAARAADLCSVPKKWDHTVDVIIVGAGGAGLAAGITALFHMGIRGILWSIFSAVVGYGVAWVLITDDGQRQIAALKEHFRR